MNVASGSKFKDGYYIITVFECYIWSTFKDGYYVITAFECSVWFDIWIQGIYSLAEAMTESLRQQIIEFQETVTSK